MTKIGVIGLSTERKIWLLYYIGKCLSTTGPVVLITQHETFFGDMDMVDYNGSFTIHKSIGLDTMASYVLMDVEGYEEGSFDQLILYSGVSRKEVFYNKELWMAYNGYNADGYVIEGLLYDSAINEKYLCHQLGLSKKDQRVHFLQFDDGDYNVMVENQYNERIRLKGLSKAYKKLLRSLLEIITSDVIKDLKRRIRTAERSY